MSCVKRYNVVFMLCSLINPETHDAIVFYGFK